METSNAAMTWVAGAEIGKAVFCISFSAGLVYSVAVCRAPLTTKQGFVFPSHTQHTSIAMLTTYSIFETVIEPPPKL